jgi:probable HAF family extracellular repeat protein
MRSAPHLAFAAAAIGAATLASAATLFTATDLGPGIPVGIDDAGAVALADGFLVADGVRTPLDLIPAAIAPSGLLIGFHIGPLDPPPDGGRYETIYDHGAVRTIILPGDATAINSSGQVTGAFVASSGQFHAFLYDAGVSRDLGPLLGSAGSFARAINDVGEVAGDSPNGVPFVSSGTGLVGLPHTALFAHAVAIDDSGRVAGSAIFPGNVQHAVLWDHGEFLDLGTLAGSSAATAINDSGDVVGFSLGAGAAFLYTEGRMFDLNNLLVEPIGTMLSSAEGINRSGQIVATGDNAHVYLLTPDPVAPESSTAVLFVAGLGLVGTVVRRRS